MEKKGLEKNDIVLDIELYFLIKRIEDNYNYFIWYGDNELWSKKHDELINELIRYSRTLEVSDISIAFYHVNQCIKIIKDNTLKDIMRQICQELELVYLTLLKHNDKKNLKKEKQSNKINENVKRLEEEILIISYEKDLNLTEIDANNIVSFLLAQKSVDDFFDNRLYPDNESYVELSKKEFIKSLELTKGIKTSNKKEATLYEIMNRITPKKYDKKIDVDSLEDGKPIKHEHKLSPFQIRSLEFLLSNYDSKYVKYLYGLSNLKGKRIPKCPSGDDFNEAREKIKNLYEIDVNKNKKLNSDDKKNYELLNQQFIEDSYHFGIFFRYSKLIDSYVEGITAILPYLANSEGAMFNNNIYFSIFLDYKLRQQEEKNYDISTEYVQFQLIIDHLVKTKSNIISDILIDKEVVNESIDKILDLIQSSYDEIEKFSDKEDGYNYFSKVVEKFYGVNEEERENPFIK